jgi:hypothetical protein
MDTGKCYGITRKKGSNSIFLGCMFVKRIRDIFNSSRNLIHQNACRVRIKAAKRMRFNWW